jgi:hypothetical protein
VSARESQEFGSWWGCVQGSAEPMAAHVRSSGQRLPRLIDGRDAFSMFQFYPQAAGMIGEILTAAYANLLFVAGLCLGLVWTHGLVGVLDKQVETIFISGVLVAGLGLGFTFYPKEHLLTSQVARPWRVLVAAVVLVTITALMTCVWDYRATQAKLVGGPAVALEVEFGIAAALCVFLGFISFRAFRGQAAGNHFFWRNQGLPLRRLEFYGRRAEDDRDARTASRSEMGADKKLAKLDKLAKRYLVEERRRKLFNRGIPPAIRHERLERGA